nr:hypothetical protein [Candidatus Sigynarchaeota archaeon]
DTTILHVANQAPQASIAIDSNQPWLTTNCPTRTCLVNMSFYDPGFDPATGVRCTLLVGGKVIYTVMTNASNGSFQMHVGLFFGTQNVSVRVDDGLGGITISSLFWTFIPKGITIWQISFFAIVTTITILVAIAAFVSDWKARMTEKVSPETDIPTP